MKITLGHSPDSDDAFMFYALARHQIDEEGYEFEHILRDIQVFMLFYLLTFSVGAAVVVLLGADLLTGITASIACLGNIGPGFGAIGPMGSFAGLHPVSKIVLTLEMWIGRLEVLTVLVLFRLEVWRGARWAAG